MGLPDELRSGAGGGAGLSPMEGADGVAAGGAAVVAAAAAAAGATGCFVSGAGAGRGTGAGIPPVERTTLRHGGAGASATGSAGASAVTGSATGAGVSTAGATGSGVSTTGSAFGATFFAGASAFLAFSLGAAFGSSTIGSPRRSRLSASRRMRSADGSSMLDEWLFTPILSSSERSRTTWFSTPSSRASS